MLRCGHCESSCGIRGENTLRSGTYKLAAFSFLVIATLVGFFFIQTHPGYFRNVDYLAALILAQLVIASLWNYEVVFFPLLLVFFLWAGMDLPYAAVGMTARWFVLIIAAAAGFVMWMRQREHHFNEFHLTALFCVLAALTSALVSADANTSILKVLSLFLLFLYGSTGARLALRGRADQFAKGLLIGSEIIVYVSAVAYLGIGTPIWGNPNSLGAVIGIVAVPVLLWGVMIAETPIQRHRRVAALLVAGILLYVALSRASILAAAVSVIVLCFAMRRQRLLLQGLFAALLFLAFAAVINPSHFEIFTNSISSEVLYKGKSETGVLGSRVSPWQETITVIKERPWFGTGFGTSYMGEYAERGSLDLSPSTGGLYTKEGTNREHGNSYLALLEYVGLIGLVPFLVLIVLVARMIVQTCRWMRETADPYHCAIPFAMILLAGLVHAFFEDWLLAVGYYLCVFFWTAAFMIRDVLPRSKELKLPVASPAHPRIGVHLSPPIVNR